MVSPVRTNHPKVIHPDTLSLADLLGELAQSPGTTFTMDAIADRILARITSLFSCEGCWLFTPGQVDDKLELKAWRGLSPTSATDLRWISNDEEAVDSTNRPLVRDYGIDDAPAGLVWPDEKIGRIAVAPMHSHDHYIGSIVLFFSNSRPLAPRQRQLLSSLSSQAGLAIRSANLFLASQELALQQERDRITREIHDGVSQNLALLMLRMEIISRLSESDPSRLKTEIQKVMDILESSVFELRRSIYALRSPGLLNRIQPAIKAGSPGAAPGNRGSATG